MPNKAKHAFGPLERVPEIIESGLVNARDILFMDEDTDAPKIGWIKKDGTLALVQSATDLTEIKNEITKIEKSFEKVDYEVSAKPNSTLVDYREEEIRIMCPVDTSWTLQTSGEGSDANSYYIGFKAYAPSEDVVSFKEDLAEVISDETMYYFEDNDFAGVDENGRKYSIVWLPVAKYDEASATWTYYGANSSTDKYIGWYYSVEWYDAKGVIVDSDCIRINLANEECFTAIKPFYVNDVVADVDAKVEEAVAVAMEEAIGIVEF